jgi:hypothetical protein
MIGNVQKNPKHLTVSHGIKQHFAGYEDYKWNVPLVIPMSSENPVVARVPHETRRC